MNLRIADALVKKNVESVAVLGLTYKADIKVAAMSPTIPFINRLKSAEVKVSLHDPLYEADEINEIIEVPLLDFPESLENFEAVVLMVGHNAYNPDNTPVVEIFRQDQLVLDNPATWTELKSDFHERNVDYRVTGESSWLQ
jgi:UDP-N-acetyl-D-mannosaminuronate dehydrogenase